MTQNTWTDAELAEFGNLTYASCAYSQAERIKGRFEMQKFIEKHGREKCDAMWKHLMEMEGKKP